MWLAAFALAALPPACDCSPTHPAERVFTADLVFTGQVFRSAGANIEYSVLKRYKGKAPVRLKVYDLGEACKAPRPLSDREYVVLARRSAGLWVTGPCEGAVPIEDARRYLTYLSAIDTGRSSLNLVTGQILFPPKAHVVALVRLRKGASILYATADDAGLFVFENVPAGDYSVEVTAPGFRTTKTPRVRAGAKGITRVFVPLEREEPRPR
jgi:hypothetical protein